MMDPNVPFVSGSGECVKTTLNAFGMREAVRAGGEMPLSMPAAQLTEELSFLGGYF